jgi:hypothetical protein
MEVMRIPTITIGSDTTVRWAFRDGDYLVWIRVPLWAPEASPNIVDLWELHDGHHALVTNRYQDLPAWFELHPTEVCGSAAFWMMRRQSAGKPTHDRMDGPNIWRVMAGDWLLWVGAPRVGVGALQNGFAAAECRECLLVIGEGATSSPAEFATYGTPQNDEISSNELKSLRAGITAIRQNGARRAIATEWLIGE